MVSQKKIGFRPLHGFVLAEEIPRTQTEGGVILPETAESQMDEPTQARVVAVGPGEETQMGHRLEMPVSVGERIYIYFPPHAAPAALTIGKKTYLLIQAKFICGVIEN